MLQPMATDVRQPHPLLQQRGGATAPHPPPGPILSPTAPRAALPLPPQAAFSAAIERFEYQGVYNGVFPVKANHDKSLIDAVLEYGAPGQSGGVEGWVELAAGAGGRRQWRP